MVDRDEAAGRTTPAEADTPDHFSSGAGSPAVELGVALWGRSPRTWAIATRRARGAPDDGAGGSAARDDSNC
jgi:hypothetical protein